MNLRLWTECITVITIVTFVSNAGAKLVKGTLVTDKDWVFLTSFYVENNNSSRFSYHFKYPVSYGKQKILLYYDDQWSSVHNSDKNCTEKLSVLKEENQQIIALDTDFTPLSRYSGCSLEEEIGQNVYNCSGSRVFRQNRSRGWYIVAARCSKAAGNVTGLQLTFTLDVPSMRTSPDTDLGDSPATRESVSVLLVIIMGSWHLSV